MLGCLLMFAGMLVSQLYGLVATGVAQAAA